MIKKLEDIGFYTLSDYRCKQVSDKSPLYRCELILTDRCNFKCTYCRGLKKEYKGDMPFDNAMNVLKLWIKDGLKNVRFSGGEPTLYADLDKLVKYAKENNVEHIALSTNGSAKLEYYKHLIDCGVNDFSISLDACCSSFAQSMAGGVNLVWDNLVNNIKELSKLTYVTVGVVVTEENVNELEKIIRFADSLGVSDIRIISSAQYNKVLENVIGIEPELINKYPILKYRIENIKEGRNVRGIKETDSRSCSLVLDDIAIVGDKHYPCIIYLREQGEPIGNVGENMRQERKEWFEKHNCYNDKICRNNCLDVCVCHNNMCMELQINKPHKIERLDSSLFEFSNWHSGHPLELLGYPNEHLRYDNITEGEIKSAIKKYAIGYCEGHSLKVRPKTDSVAIMCQKDDSTFWFHMRNNEFVKIFRNEEAG